MTKPHIVNGNLSGIINLIHLVLGRADDASDGELRRKRGPPMQLCKKNINTVCAMHQSSKTIVHKVATPPIGPRPLFTSLNPTDDDGFLHRVGCGSSEI